MLLKVISLSIFLLESVLGSPASAAVKIPEDHFPRIANYYLRWDLSGTQAYELSRYDLLILDMEVQVNTPKQLELIRSLNPDIIILAYVTSQEILDPPSELPKNSLRYRLYHQLAPEWFLTSANGSRIANWPSTSMLNVTNLGPEIQGKRWNTFLPEFMHKEVMKSGYWDGIFFDNAWDDVSFVHHGDLDINADGLANEDPVSIDNAWKSGMEEMLKTSRAFEGEEAILLGNGGDGFRDSLNGRMFESFPTPEEGGWTGSLQSYQIHLSSSRDPAISIINVNTDNTGIMEDYDRFRFGLASALMGDGFYSFDDGDQGHAVNWFFDEYKIELGRPTGKAKNVFSPKQNAWQHGVWRRDFQQGMVLLNSTNAVVEIPLEGFFETIEGTQDRAVNTGEIIDRVILQPQDGRLLLRPFSFLDDVVLSNGSDTKIFSLEGEEFRKPFVAKEARFSPNEIIIRTDLNHAGGRETVVAKGNAIRILSDRGKLTNRFYPYGSEFRGRVLFGVGQLLDDEQKEIVTSTDVGGGPQIRIFNHRGQMRHAGFFAFNRRQRGGASVALADVNGDGRDEIIVGAGKGSVPLVRIFSADGQVIHSGFRVFDGRFRGGVSVAAGRLRHGRQAEIVVAPASGGGPHVRIFKSDGSLLRTGFFAFDPRAQSGLVLGVGDVNFDQKMEIIVQKKALR